MLAELSKELQDQYPGVPKNGDVRVYRLMGITKKPLIMDDNGNLVQEGRTAFTIPTTRGLPSSYVIQDGDEQKSVVYIDRMLPTIDPKQTRQMLGEVVFRQEDAGEIRIHKENYQQMKNIDEFLFFCPWLKNNKDKDFFVRNKLGFFIEMESRDEIAQNFLEQDEIMSNAKNLVRDMEEIDRNVLVTQLKLGMPNIMTSREKLERLIRYSGEIAGARRIMTLSSDKDTVLRKLIRKAQETNVIKKNGAGTEMIWVKGEESICNKLPKKTLEDSMIVYFASEDGNEVLKTLKEVVEAKIEAPKKPAAKKEAADIETS